MTSKIETEISHVWRQIGVMYQEVSSSKQALNKLQEQTEAYVNGTFTTMDSMEGKVYETKYLLSIHGGGFKCTCAYSIGFTNYRPNARGG